MGEEIGQWFKTCNHIIYVRHQPAWHYVLIAMLVLLILEWIVYNQRVFV